MFYKNISNNTIYIQDKHKLVIIHPNQIVKLKTIPNRYNTLLVKQEGIENTSRNIEKNISRNIEKNTSTNTKNPIAHNNLMSAPSNINKQIQVLQNKIQILNDKLENNTPTVIQQDNTILNNLLQQIIDILKSGSVVQPIYKQRENFNFNDNFEPMDIVAQPEIDLDNLSNLEDLDPILANLLSNAER